MSERCTALARTLPPPPTALRRRTPTLVDEGLPASVATLDLASLPVGAITHLRIQLGVGAWGGRCRSLVCSQTLF